MGQVKDEHMWLSCIRNRFSYMQIKHYQESSTHKYTGKGQGSSAVTQWPQSRFTCLFPPRASEPGSQGVRELLMEATNRRLNINTSIHLICEFTATNDAINIKKGKTLRQHEKERNPKMMSICRS